MHSGSAEVASALGSVAWASGFKGFGLGGFGDFRWFKSRLGASRTPQGLRHVAVLLALEKAFWGLNKERGWGYGILTITRTRTRNPNMVIAQDPKVAGL